MECKPSNPEKLGLHYEGLLRIVIGLIYHLEQNIVSAEYENAPTSLADWDIRLYYVEAQESDGMSRQEFCFLDKADIDLINLEAKS